MRIAVSHPGCGPFVQQTVKAFEEAEILEAFYTTFVYHPEDRLSSFLRFCMSPLIKNAEAEFSRRRLFACPLSKCRTYPYKELVRTLASHSAVGARAIDRIWEWSERSFDRWVSSRLSAAADAVYTYEHAALETILKAKKSGKKIFLEQPSQHHLFYERLVKRQITEYSDLSGLATYFYLSPLARQRNQRRDRELAEADWIICNSRFTRRTLLEAGIPDSKVIVIPLGFTVVSAEGQSHRSNSDKLIFLNVGTQSLRKGSPLLYKVWKRMNPRKAELWIIGKNTLPRSFQREFPENVRIFPNMPCAELVKYYGEADVMVFPTLADGFGMVITEAMSRGLPVITTDCSAGPDLIEHGINGWIIPAGNEKALAERIRWCIAHRDQVPLIGNAAAEKARTWQWEDYRLALVHMIKERIAR